MEVDVGSTEITWEDVPALLDDLHELATRLLSRWPGMESLQPTLLVNTALARQRRKDKAWEQVTWSNRHQFFGQVYRAMRQKLVDYRRHQTTGGYRAQRRVSVKELEDYNRWRAWTEDPDMAIALAAALESLENACPHLLEVVQLRFFSGLTWPEVARMLDCSPSTAKRRWEDARLLMEASIRSWWSRERDEALT